MVETVVHTIGRDADFPTLASWAATLPPDLLEAGIAPVAELTAGAEDPGAVVIETRCSPSAYVTIRAARGHSFADLNDPIVDPLAPAIGLGAAIRTLSGPAISVRGTGTRVSLAGLQIVAEDGAAVADDGQGALIS